MYYIFFRWQNQGFIKKSISGQHSHSFFRCNTRDTVWTQ